MAALRAVRHFSVAERRTEPHSLGLLVAHPDARAASYRPPPARRPARRPRLDDDLVNVALGLERTQTRRILLAAPARNHRTVVLQAPRTGPAQSTTVPVVSSRAHRGHGRLLAAARRQSAPRVVGVFQYDDAGRNRSARATSRSFPSAARLMREGERTRQRRTPSCSRVPRPSPKPDFVVASAMSKFIEFRSRALDTASSRALVGDRGSQLRRRVLQPYEKHGVTPHSSRGFATATADATNPTPCHGRAARAPTRRSCVKQGEVP